MENTLILVMRQLVQFLDGKVSKTEIVNHLNSVSTPDVDKVVRAIALLDNNLAKRKVDISPLKDGLSALEKQLRLIPKELPKQTGEMRVSNLNDYTKAFKDLESAIKALHLNVNVPQTKINVEKPNLAPLQTVMTSILGAINTLKFPDSTDVKGVEKRLEGLGKWFAVLDKNDQEAQKLLKKLIDKPIGGGSSSSSGGGGSTFVDSSGNTKYPVLNPDGSLSVEDMALTPNVDDTVPPFVYIGKSLPGTPTSTAAWQIKRIDQTSGAITTWASGNSNFDKSWDNRSSLTYS